MCDTTLNCKWWAMSDTTLLEIEGVLSAKPPRDCGMSDLLKMFDVLFYETIW